MPLQFDSRRPELQDNPYPYYGRLRNEDPVHWSEPHQAWVLTRYADVSAVLRDPRFSAAARLRDALDSLPPAAQAELAVVAGAVSKTLAYLDLPEHTRLRRLVNIAFQPRVVETLRPQIQKVADALIDRVQDSGHMDVVSDYAHPLRLLVSAEMLGLPAGDIEELMQWVDEFTTSASVHGLGDPGPRRCAERAMGRLTGYFRTVLEERRQRPGGDLISALLTAQYDGDRLDDDELVAACLMLFIGGNQSTRAIVSIGILALLRHPDQLNALYEDRSRIGSAVEELLRYDALNQGLIRIAIQEVVLGGKTIHRGERVLLLLTAANRDPAQFTAPDRLDVERNPNRHIAFGSGVHFCTGAPLGRAVIQIALSTVVSRLPELRLAAETVEWRDGLRAHGLMSLPVSFLPPA